MEPGAPGIWEAALAWFDRIAAQPGGLVEQYGPDADRLLLEQGIVTDDFSRQRLVEEVERTYRQFAEQQLKRANGDYSPDPKANRFPPLSVASTVPAKGPSGGPTIRALFELW